MRDSVNYWVYFITVLACLNTICASTIPTSTGQQNCANNPPLNNAERLPSTNVNIRAPIPTSPPEDDFTKANRIALDKCYEYAAYRYKNYTIPAPILGDPPINKYDIDCQEIQPLIVGGTNADQYEFPHMALLGYDDDVTDENKWNCGGSLISEQFILSAAHCTFDGSGEQVKWAALGLLSRENFKTDMIGKNLFRIIRRINHPEYTSKTTQFDDNDIALYKLEKPIELSSHIRPTCIHQKSSPIAIGAHVSVTGWGQMGAGNKESAILQKVTILNLDASRCVTAHRDNPALQKGFDVNKMICGGHPKEEKDTCGGDSGGPMQIRMEEEDTKCMWEQIGITSIGSRYCGEKDKPAIYTRVSAYLPWIQKHVWPANA